MVNGEYNEANNVEMQNNAMYDRSIDATSGGFEGRTRNKSMIEFIEEAH